MKARHIMVLAAATQGSTGTTIVPMVTTVARHLVSGYVHAGPTCPVVHNPPDPRCEDRAAVDARLAVLDGDGEAVAEVRTDSEGLFVVRLTAGTYTLTPQAVAGLLGTAQPQEFTVGPGASLDLDVDYDTGIR